MSRLIRGALIIPLLLLAHQAEAGSGGSIYSFLGIGDLRMSPNVRSAGMGYTGYAIPGPYTINTLSPATWAKIDRARIEGESAVRGVQFVQRNERRASWRGLTSAAPCWPSRVSTDQRNRRRRRIHTVQQGRLQHLHHRHVSSAASTRWRTASTTPDVAGSAKGILGTSWAPYPEHCPRREPELSVRDCRTCKSSSSPASSTFVAGDQTEESTMSGTDVHDQRASWTASAGSVRCSHRSRSACRIHHRHQPDHNAPLHVSLHGPARHHAGDRRNRWRSLQRSVSASRTARETASCSPRTS